jgi:hypothetical protein
MPATALLYDGDVSIPDQWKLMSLTTMKTTAEYKASKFSGTKLSHESYKVIAGIIENSSTSGCKIGTC